MKDLLLTTALISLMAVPVYAQTTTDNATDGVTDGATTGTDAATGADTTTGTDTTTTGSGTTNDGTSTATDTTTTGTATTDMATGTDVGATATITPPEGYTEYDRMALTSEDLQGATVYDANGESVGEITELVMASTTTGAAATTDMSQNTTGTDATTDMSDEPTGTTTTDGTAAGDTGASVSVDGTVSHVVLDVGGFLGIGAHTVAVPMDALQVFRDANEDVRVYLPWTQAQLEALPEYNADDPSTLGNMEQPTGSTGSATDTMGGTDTQQEGSVTTPDAGDATDGVSGDGSTTTGDDTITGGSTSADTATGGGDSTTGGSTD